MQTADKITITGGKKLSGTIKVRGAKNFVPKAMVASLLSSDTSIIKNVPNIKDVEIVSKLLKLHNANVDYNSNTGELVIEPKTTKEAKIADVELLAGESRIPILLCGPLIHKLGKALIPNLGGCEIGGRPVDMHFESLRKMGAEITKRHNSVELKAPNGLKGAKIELNYPSVGATEQTLLAAVTAKGITELKNAAIEPEILDLISVLQKMGAIITVQTDRTIEIEGVEELTGFTHSALTDRNEVASWACLALATNGKIFVEGANQGDMTTFLNVFRKIGGNFVIDEKGIEFSRKTDALKSIALETNVHPGFMTDWQQPLVVALTQAEGTSIVHETVYENRFGFTKTLNEMGAQIQLFTECLGSTKCRFLTSNYKHSAVIVGPKKLTSSNINIPDLRAGFSYIIAALSAEGQTQVSNLSLVYRGYENFKEKLKSIGADFS